MYVGFPAILLSPNPLHSYKKSKHKQKMEFLFIPQLGWVGNYSQVRSINRQWIIKLYCSITVIPPLLSWGYKNILPFKIPNIFASENFLNIYKISLTKPSVSELSSKFLKGILMCFNKLSCIFVQCSQLAAGVVIICQYVVWEEKYFNWQSISSSDKNKSKQNWQETSW